MKILKERCKGTIIGIEINYENVRGSIKLLSVMSISSPSHYEPIKCTYRGNQCDQIKIAKCLEKLPKNDFSRKMNDFDAFTKID